MTNLDTSKPDSYQNKPAKSYLNLKYGDENILVNYPNEWRKYMIPGKIRTFAKNTPEEIKKEAKLINAHIYEVAEKYFFFFEDENESLV